jgi:hypothetical protein
MADVGMRRQGFRMLLREVLGGGRQLEPNAIDKPLRVLAAVKRIIERGVEDGAFRAVDPLLTHLSLVGSLSFFFATTSFRERVLANRSLQIKPPDAGAYVKHIQDLITYGLAADRSTARPSSPHRRAVKAPPRRASQPTRHADRERKGRGA